MCVYLHMYFLRMFCCFRLRTDTTVTNHFGTTFGVSCPWTLSLRDKGAMGCFSSLLLPFPPFCFILFSNSPCSISVSSEKSTIHLTSSSRLPVANCFSSSGSSWYYHSQKEGKSSRINYSPVKCKKHIFRDIHIISQHSKRLTSCTLNGKPGTVF